MVNALGNIGVRLLPVAQRGWTELHVRRDLVARMQVGCARIGDIEPRLAVGHIRAREHDGQTIAALIGNGILRHARRDRLHITGDVLRGYIDGGKPEDRIERIESMRGLTMLQISDGKGEAIISTMCTEKATTDPIAGKLVVNMINCLTDKNK